MERERKKEFSEHCKQSDSTSSIIRKDRRRKEKGESKDED